MGDFELHWFGVHFERDYSRKKAAAFEEWFGRICACAYGTDFEPVKAGGPKGDLKCDGWHRPEGRVFQCYAPEKSLSAKNAIKKIKADFTGALKHWGDLCKTWAFVHNDPAGLPAVVTQYIDKLRVQHPAVTIEVWNEQQLRDLVLGLRHDHLVGLFGPMPTAQTLQDLRFADLEPVVRAIEKREPPVGEGLAEPPSPVKLEWNKLSQDAAAVLSLGRRKHRLVQHYFDRHPDPTLGDRIATGFNAHYRSLKAQGMSAGEIFTALQDFAHALGAPEQQAAGLAVMSFMFENCNIFDNPPQDAAA